VEGAGHDMVVAMSRHVGEVGVGVEGRVCWCGGDRNSCFRGPCSGGLGRGLSSRCRWGAWLGLLMGCLCWLGVDDVLWGLVGAAHLNGVVFGGDGGIYVESRRDRVHVRT
jgi:hypothetical protein